MMTSEQYLLIVCYSDASEITKTFSKHGTSSSVLYFALFKTANQRSFMRMF